MLNFQSNSLYYCSNERLVVRNKFTIYFFGITYIIDFKERTLNFKYQNIKINSISILFVVCIHIHTHRPILTNIYLYATYY